METKFYGFHIEGMKEEYPSNQPDYGAWELFFPIFMMGNISYI